MFSRRAHWDAPTNQLTRVREELTRNGTPLVDLTISNPTKASLDYPLDALADALARGARATYDPDALGLRTTREALAEHLGCSADDLVITASTSEAYSFLFKLLTDPGDTIVTATPSYPLLEHLAQMELVSLQTFALELHRRWELHASHVSEKITPRTRAIVVVNPNNPTGSYVTAEEQDALAKLGIPIISDEVFHPFAFTTSSPSFVRADVLTFTLGGLSKSAGLPHYKLGWIRVSGPERERREAIAALEMIADNFLSVATPVQVALPELLRFAPQITNAIRERTRANLELLQREFAIWEAAQVLPVEGGWSAVIRVPRTSTDEELALHFMEEHHVVVQPGYFFDFDREGFFVVSLLTPPDDFAEGVRRILE